VECLSFAQAGCLNQFLYFLHELMSSMLDYYYGTVALFPGWELFAVTHLVSFKAHKPGSFVPGWPLSSGLATVACILIVVKFQTTSTFLQAVTFHYSSLLGSYYLGFHQRKCLLELLLTVTFRCSVV